VAVSIILPALNEAALIADSVASALAAGPREVIVVDGGSHDDTVSLARAAGATVLSCLAGRATQQNAGAGMATGDILLFLHADNRLPVDGLVQIEQALTDRRVGCGAFRQAIEAHGWLYRLLERGNAWRAAYRGLPYGDQGIFVRRSLFEQVGGFPRVNLMEDVLLMRRLRRETWPVLLPGPLFVSARRWRRQGVIHQTARNWCLLAAVRLGVHPDRLAKYY
jgi:rSAM/selenodomain-associated transferase 2